MQIIENFIPEDYQNTIIDTLCASDFPWFMNDNQSGVDRPRSVDLPMTPIQYGFNHNMFYSDGRQTSRFYPLFEQMLNNVAALVKCDIALMRVRAGLLTNMNMSGISNPHVDTVLTEHKTLLYYAMDSDAPTVMFKERYDPNSEIPVDFHTDHTIFPKKGTAVLFDGWTYHASAYPLEYLKRIVVNINFKEER